MHTRYVWDRTYALECACTKQTKTWTGLGFTLDLGSVPKQVLDCFVNNNFLPARATRPSLPRLLFIHRWHLLWRFTPS